MSGANFKDKAMPSGISEAEDQKFQAERDLRSLIKVEEIRKDKARLKRAMKIAEEQMKALETVSNG